MKQNFLFMDESYNKETRPHISSLTGILIPLEKYPVLRSKFYDILQFEIKLDDNQVNLSPPELHFSDLLRHHESDEVRFNVLWSLASLVVETQLEIYRVGYYITPNTKKMFDKDKHLMGLCWLRILFMVQSKLKSEIIIPVMDAGFRKNMEQMTKQFSGLIKSIDVMRELGYEENISVKHSENIMDVFYADDKYSIFTQLADIVSGLRNISDTANQDANLISEYKQKLLPISEYLQNTPLREEIVPLKLNSEVEGPKQ